MTRLSRSICAVLLVGGLAAAATPWRVARATVAAALGDGFVQAAGLRAVVAGPVTVKLLPRPRIQATELSVTAKDGAVLVDAPVLKAELDIPSLMRGVWRISSATLVDPTVTVDIDRIAAQPHGVSPVDAAGPPFRIRLRGGLIRTRSASSVADLLVTGVDATATWPAGGGAVAASGVATWRGTTAQFAGDLQHPAQSFTPEGSSATLQIDSPLFSLSADGILSGGTQQQFAGHASLITGSLPKLFRTLDGIPIRIGAKRAQISGDLVARPHDLSLSNARLRLDRTRLEGTLAWRRDAGRDLVAGTLATEFLDIDALMGGEFDRGAVEDAFGRRLAASPFATDIDMRVSATAARLGRVVVDDAAVAALVRGDRLELTLDEAGAYGGFVKARALALLGPDGIDAHAELSAKQVDLGRLSDGLTDHDRVGGRLNGHVTLDGRGASLRDVVADLAGSGQVGIDGGRLAGLSLAQALRPLGRRTTLDTDRRGSPTMFDKALWDVSVRDGIVTIPDGKLTAPGVVMSFGAATGLSDGSVDLHAVAAQADTGGAPLRDGRTMPFDMRGTWAGPLVLVGHASGMPAVALPIFDGLSAQR